MHSVVSVYRFNKIEDKDVATLLSIKYEPGLRKIFSKKYFWAVKILQLEIKNELYLDGIGRRNAIDKSGIMFT